MTLRDGDFKTCAIVVRNLSGSDYAGNDSMTERTRRDEDFRIL